MAELNFGLLTPPGSQSIGNAFVSGMDQAQAAQARDLQMQQSMRQGQMAELQFRKAQDAETKLNQWYAKIAEDGGPSDHREIEKQMIGSGIQSVVDMGLKARMARLNIEREREGFAAANAPPAAQPVATMPVPEPGSFGADVATRRAAEMFTPPQERTNMMPGAAAAAPAGVNSLLDDLNRRISANVALGTKQGDKQADILQKQVDALSKRYTVGNTLMGGEGNIYGTAPEKAPAPPSMVAEYTFAKTPDGGSFRGSYQDFVTARAAAGRTPAQPAAPTITQIVDPTDSAKMITIDARRYAGGGAGSPGVIGVSGKEPSAALRENKIEAGKTLLADEVSNLRAALNTLNVARAIPSTERGTLSNIASSIAASGVGQVAGRIGGTQAQTERDVIASSKLRLVNAIKQATGMSAQQLNSNVELQTMLKSLSDPSQSIEANIRNLDNIEKSYINATPTAMPRAPTGAPATNIDALLKKYQ